MKRILLGLMMMSGLSLMAASMANAVTLPSFCEAATGTSPKYYAFQMTGAEPSVASSATQNLPLKYVAGVGVLEFGKPLAPPNQYTCEITGGEMIYIDDDYLGFLGGPQACQVAGSTLGGAGTPCFDGQAGGAEITGTVAPGPNGSQTLTFAATFGFVNEGGATDVGLVTLPFSFTTFTAASGATLVGNSNIPVGMHADPLTEGTVSIFPYGDTYYEFADNLPCMYLAQAALPWISMIGGCGGGPDTILGSLLSDSFFATPGAPPFLGETGTASAPYPPGEGFTPPPMPLNAVESVSPSMTFIAQRQATTATLVPVPTAYGAAPYIGNSAILCSGFAGPSTDSIAAGQTTLSDEATGAYGATSGSLTNFSTAGGGAAFGSLSFNSNDDIGNTTGLPNYDCDFQQLPINLYADGTSNNEAILYDENFPQASATCRDADAGLVKTDGSTYPLDIPGGPLPTAAECTGTCANGLYYGGPLNDAHEGHVSSPVGAYEVNSSVVWGSTDSSTYTIVTGISTVAPPFYGTLTYPGETATCTGLSESATPGTLTATPSAATTLTDSGILTADTASIGGVAGNVTESSNVLTITMAGDLPTGLTVNDSVKIAGVVCPSTPLPSQATDAAKFDGTYTVTAATPSVYSGSPPVLVTPGSFTYTDSQTWVGTPPECHSGTADAIYPQLNTLPIKLTNTSEGACLVVATLVPVSGAQSSCKASVNPAINATQAAGVSEGDTVMTPMTVTCNCTLAAAETDTYTLYLDVEPPLAQNPANPPTDALVTYTNANGTGSVVPDLGQCPQLPTLQSATGMTILCKN